MKTILLTLMMILTVGTLSASQARADGFVCGTADRELAVQVYHFTQPSQGTRNAAVLILADPTAERGQQLIARFTRVDSNFTKRGALYIGHPDVATFSKSSANGFLASTLLPVAQIRMVTLEVQFNYGQPLPADTIIDGMLTLQKLNGEQVRKPVTCQHYVKSH